MASLLAAATLVPTAFWAQSAQACDCIEQSVAQNFDRKSHVFTGEVLFSVELPQTILYLSSVKRSYTGCRADEGLVWVQTEQDWASCGTRFTPGESYLFFANQVSGIFGFALQTDACAGNMREQGLSEADLAYLETRQNCCGGECACQPGVEAAECEVDPCSLAAPCETVGSIRCEVNNCGGCNAEFFNSDGIRVCTGEQEVDPRCEDHKDYDFGDCDADPGWLVLDGSCQRVSSGCGTIPGPTPLFESKAACESVCQPKRFACGDELTCDKRTSYCAEELPGQEPPPGEPTAYYECRPLPEGCLDAPSCATCFEPHEGSDGVLSPDGFPAYCSDSAGVFISVAFP